MGSKWKKLEEQRPVALLSVVSAAGARLLGAPTAMLGDEERKPRSLYLLSTASTRLWAYPSSYPGPCASDAREEFHLPKDEMSTQRDDEGRCPRAHDHQLLWAAPREVLPMGLWAPQHPSHSTPLYSVSVSSGPLEMV